MDSGPSSSFSAPDPSSKRRRVEPEVIRDAELWLSDGNVVIMAIEEHGTDTAYAFRVHKSVLAKQSSVFEDMFSLPQSSDIEVYDGLPVVKLKDPPDYVKSLLSILYDPSRIPMHSPAYVNWQKEFDAIEGPLRLSAKYELTALHSRLAEIFMSHWPTTLDQWDEMYRSIRKQRAFEEPSRRPDPARAINLAIDADIPGALPAAFYSLHCLYKVPTAIDIRGPGSSLDSSFEQCIAPLRHAQLKQFLLGREWLNTAMSRLLSWGVMHELGNKQDQTCGRAHPGEDSTMMECNVMARKWWGEWVLQDRLIMDYLSDDHLYGWLLIRKNLPANTGSFKLCPTCRGHLTKVLEGCRKYIWNEMPYFFGIKSREDDLQYGWDIYM